MSTFVKYNDGRSEGVVNLAFIESMQVTPVDGEPCLYWLEAFGATGKRYVILEASQNECRVLMNRLAARENGS